MGRFNWDLFGLSCTEVAGVTRVTAIARVTGRGETGDCVDWTLMADFLLILDWRSRQPVLLVQCSRAAQAEERTRSLPDEPDRVRSVLPGVSSTLVAVHLPGKKRFIAISLQIPSVARRSGKTQRPQTGFEPKTPG